MVGTEEDVPDIPAALDQAGSLRRRIPTLLALESSKTIARKRASEMDAFTAHVKDATADLRLL